MQLTMQEAREQFEKEYLKNNNTTSAIFSRSKKGVYQFELPKNNFKIYIMCLRANNILKE